MLRLENIPVLRAMVPSPCCKHSPGADLCESPTTPRRMYTAGSCLHEPAGVLPRDFSTVHRFPQHNNRTLSARHCSRWTDSAPPPNRRSPHAQHPPRLRAPPPCHSYPPRRVSPSLPLDGHPSTHHPDLPSLLALRLLPCPPPHSSQSPVLSVPHGNPPHDVHRTPPAGPR